MKWINRSHCEKRSYLFLGKRQNCIQNWIRNRWPNFSVRFWHRTRPKITDHLWFKSSSCVYDEILLIVCIVLWKVSFLSRNFDITWSWEENRPTTGILAFMVESRVQFRVYEQLWKQSFWVIFGFIIQKNTFSFIKYLPFTFEIRL